MKEYIVEFDKYNKVTTEIENGNKYQERVEADEPEEAIEFLKDWFAENGEPIETDEYEYINFTAHEA